MQQGSWELPITTFDPSRPDFTPYGFTCMRWQASRTPRPDRHNEIELNLLESGTLTSLVGGSRVRLEAGRLHVFWGAMPHQIIDHHGVDSFLVATIPLAWILQWQLPGKLMQPLLRGEVLRSGEPNCAQEDVMMLSRWIEYMQDSPKSLQRIILLEIQARLLRFALSGPAALPGAARRGPAAKRSELGKAERLAGFIAQRCTEQLSAADMGRAVGLHPNYAMGLFKNTFGITLNEYLTRQRISHAQRFLITSEEKVTEIALRSGFSSISRFNAAFHDICQCSPSQYRMRRRVVR
jgi:AraC-like DNA-binding protein